MRIVLVQNDDFSLWQFRRSLISRLVSDGHSVVLMTPAGPWTERLVGLGAKHVDVPFVREFRPTADAIAFVRLIVCFLRLRPDIVHSASLKPNIYAVIAARLCGTPTVLALVEGLGSMYTPGSGAGWKWRFARGLLKLALRMCDRVWVMNRSDAELLTSHGFVQPHQLVLIRGTGISIDEYSCAAVGPRRSDEIRRQLRVPTDLPLALMFVARLSWSKGVQYFIEAARLAQARHARVHFLLAGPLDPAAEDGVPAAYLESVELKNLTVSVGFVERGSDLIAASDIVVLPSLYREGIPRVLLEAGALEKPAVVFDNVGCNDVIADGTTGFIVPRGDAAMLAARIEELAAHPEEATAMGRAARRRVATFFSDRVVIPAVLSEFYRCTGPEPRFVDVERS